MKYIQNSLSVGKNVKKNTIYLTHFTMKRIQHSGLINLDNKNMILHITYKQGAKYVILF